MSGAVTYRTPPLPCPFCGSTPVWSHNSTGSMPAFTEGIERVWRWQSSLFCRGYRCPRPHVSGFGQTDWHGGNASAQQYAMADALEVWNRRVATGEQA